MTFKLHRGGTLIGSCEPIKNAAGENEQFGAGVLTIRNGVELVPVMQHRMGQSAMVPPELRGKVTQYRMPAHLPPGHPDSRASGALEPIPYGQPSGFMPVEDEAILRIELEDGTMADPKHISVDNFGDEGPWIVSFMFLEED